MYVIYGLLPEIKDWWWWWWLTRSNGVKDFFVIRLQQQWNRLSVDFHRLLAYFQALLRTKTQVGLYVAVNLPLHSDSEVNQFFYPCPIGCRPITTFSNYPALSVYCLSVSSLTFCLLFHTHAHTHTTYTRTNEQTSFCLLDKLGRKMEPLSLKQPIICWRIFYLLSRIFFNLFSYCLTKLITCQLLS